MKENTKYMLNSPDGSPPIGYFLNNIYYSLPSGREEGRVDENGLFYSYLAPVGTSRDQPAGKIAGGILTRLSDNLQLRITEAS